MNGPGVALEATRSWAVGASGAAERPSVLRRMATQAVPGFLRGLAQPCPRLPLQLDASLAVSALSCTASVHPHVRAMAETLGLR